MDTGSNESSLNTYQKVIVFSFFCLLLIFLFTFRNLFFQPTLLLKSFGESSIDPEIAFNNNKPTFIEFYAEWCEICKEMAPKVSKLKDRYDKDINFVFLNVDNQKWEKYLRRFDVNGIPQVNLFDYEGNLKANFIGQQKENTLEESLNKLINNQPISEQNVSLELSQIKENINNMTKPRSHG